MVKSATSAVVGEWTTEITREWLEFWTNSPEGSDIDDRMREFWEARNSRVERPQARTSTDD